MEKIRHFIHSWAWILLVAFCALGLFYPLIGSIALLCMLAPALVSFFKGRMWCGSFCPRGSFNDKILSRVSRKKSVPGFLKSTYFKNAFFVLMMSFFAWQLVIGWKDAESVGSVFVRMILITTGVTILLGTIFKPRTWCMICPMGTLSGYISGLSRFRSGAKHVTFDREKCVNCKVCSKNCPIEIDVLKHKEEGKVAEGGCLKCEVCVKKCPKKSLYVA